MLTYNGKPLKFTSYSKIEDKNPKWVAQSAMDDFQHSLQIWEVEGEYFVTIG